MDRRGLWQSVRCKAEFLPLSGTAFSRAGEYFSSVESQTAIRSSSGNAAPSNTISGASVTVPTRKASTGSSASAASSTTREPDTGANSCERVKHGFLQLNTQAVAEGILATAAAIPPSLTTEAEEWIYFQLMREFFHTRQEAPPTLAAAYCGLRAAGTPQRGNLLFAGLR